MEPNDSKSVRCGRILARHVAREITAEEAAAQLAEIGMPPDRIEEVLFIAAGGSDVVVVDEPPTP